VANKKREASREQMPLPFDHAVSPPPSRLTREGQVLQFQPKKSSQEKSEEGALRLLLDKAAKLNW
jgi:hypothetical protein